MQPGPKNIIDVEYNDGTKSRFDLKAPSISRLYKFADLLANRDTFGIVALCTGQPDAMLDRLTPESFGALSVASWDRYLPEVVTLAKSDASLAMRVFPILNQIIGTFGALRGVDGAGNADTAEQAS